MSSSTKTLRFVSACLPPLDDGDYRVDVEQTVSDLGGGERDRTFYAELAFTVAGPRFSLNPADVYSLYPPPDRRIAFEGQLPHVVFTRKTLPWERLIGPRFSPAEAVPWIALLVLHTTGTSGSPFEAPAGGSPIDPFEIRTGTVADLLSPPAGTLGPQVRLDRHESRDDVCRFIDLPADLFTGIAPRLDELRWLAHARIVATGDKPEQDAGDGEFSVLVANRLPHASAENTALAVSLEGFEEALPPASLAGHHFVRLAVLTSWSFSMGGEDPFDALFVAANTGLLSIHSPHVAGSPAGEATVNPPGQPSPPASPNTFADDTVNSALASGYAALDHRLRDGGRTFSWYRGPLIPDSQLPFGQPRGKFSDFGFADQVLRYDPHSGLFDTTYAAAWQLGRLLALQNPAFGNALRAYLTQAMHVTRAAMAQTSVTGYFKPLAGINDGDDGWATALVTSLGRRAAGLEATGTSTAPPASAPSALAVQAAEAMAEATAGRKVPSPAAEFLSDPRSMQSMLDATPEPEPAVSEWLAELTLLYGVPFEYLVPDETMLPMESLRFFYVDENWVERLLDGALSIAVADTGSSSVQNVLFRLLTQVYVKPAAVGAVPRVRLAKIGGVPPGSPTTVPVKWPLAGFLVRSQIVGSMKGIEVAAYRASGSPREALPPLRFDRIGENVLLAIYDAPIDALTFRHPPESFHFGIDGFERRPPKLVQKLRSLKTGLIHSPPANANVVLRGGSPGDSGLGVLDVAATADSIERALVKAGELASPGALTAADFAIQMVQSPEEVTFRFTYPGSP